MHAQYRRMHRQSTSAKNKSLRCRSAADRPARRCDSAHAKYTISHHVVVKQFLLLGLAAEYRS